MSEKATTSSRFSNGQIFVLLSIGCLILVVSLVALGIGFIGISSGDIPTKSWAPDSLRYETKPGFKMVAATLKEHTDVSVEKCKELCDNNPDCMSISYMEPKKKCILHHQNRESDPSSYTSWDEWDYYGKNDVYSKFPVEKGGRMDNTGMDDKSVKDVSQRDCLLRCVYLYKDGCKGFNYDPNTQECEPVPIEYAGNELFFDGSKPVKFFSVKGTKEKDTLK